MKAFAIAAGAASSDVFMDRAGFSTYDTMFRAHEVFNARRVIIVTQNYHLYRALYLARAQGLEAFGVAAESPNYPADVFRGIREVLARSKDFVFGFFHPQPVFQGEKIPISGDGDLTDQLY